MAFGNFWMYNSSTGFYEYQIGQSLRFEDGDSPQLTFTPSSAGNQKTWTLSVWVKRGNLGSVSTIWSGGTGGSESVELSFETTNAIRVLSSNSDYLFLTTALFRDVGAWYHIVLQNDTTQSAVNDRTKLYVNGTQITSFSTDNRSNFSQNYDTGVNSTNAHYISRWINGGQFFDGYMAEFNFLDGLAYDASYFGTTSNGVWIPKKYSGSYGTNGWHLDFADSSDIGNNANSTDGTNDWTPSNLAATDVVPDSPTNNFATLNSIYHSASQAALTEGNLKADTAGLVNAANGYGAVSTFAIPKDKKIYIEVECTDGVGSNWFAGFASQSGLESGPSSTNVGGSNAITVYNRSVYVNGSETDYGSSAGLGGTGAANLAAGDILGCMCDGATGKVWFSRNGTYFKTPTTNDSGTTGDPAGGNHEIGTITNGTTEDVFFVLGGNTSVSSIFVNFGQDSTNVASANADANGLGTFEYAVPTGFLALCTSNLPEPTIGANSDTQATNHFETKLWSSDVVNPTAGQKQISLNFQPDWVWSKDRAAGESHYAVDSVRGDNDGNKLLMPNRNNTEGGDAVGSVTAKYDFTSTGFDIIDTNSAGGEVYYNAGSASSPRTYVGWCWKAGGTAVSNEAGSITSQVSANTDAGFSISTYTGDNASGASTVGHGLGKPPSLVIVRRRDTSGDWIVGHDGLAVNAFANNKFLKLNTTSATFTNAVVWGSQPTNSVVQITTGSGATNLNASGATYVMYSFAEIDGFSKIGTFAGNSSSDGTFVFTGFRVAAVWIKSTSSGTDWCIYDNKRLGYNVNNNLMRISQSGAPTEQTDDDIDFLSNGFKMRRNSPNFNQGTLIYYAFAEAPFKYSLAR